MATSGYRTLCIAERELTEQQYQQWEGQYKAASVAIRDREAQASDLNRSEWREVFFLTRLTTLCRWPKPQSA